MRKTTIASLLSAAVSAGWASAATITFSTMTPDPLSGAAGNELNYSADGIDITVTGSSLLGGTEPWVDSYVGRYEYGLGVTNTNEGDGTYLRHLVDSIGSIDRINFEFSEAVSLDQVALAGVLDTDFSVYYLSGGSWTLLEQQEGGFGEMLLADVNGGGIESTGWAIGASPSGDEFIGSGFKIFGIGFNSGGSAPPGGGGGTQRVPDTGGSLLLLGIGLVALRLVAANGKK